MLKYTANYTYTNPNFVIQNLEDAVNTDEEWMPLLYVLKNILQRGFPTIMSKYLQKRIGKIHKLNNFEERFMFISSESPKWYSTIKGGVNNNPALDFFERIIPDELEEYAFIQKLIIPEVDINEITDKDNQDFINQQVDFYLPLCNLVIEIDGYQHKELQQKMLDEKRNNYLKQYGINTIRISTDELEKKTYSQKITEIIKACREKEGRLRRYRQALDKISKNDISDTDYTTKLLPTAIIRFQILLIELLLRGIITFDKNWSFNILCEENLYLEENGKKISFIELAIEDTLEWIKNLYKLRYKKDIPKVKYDITYSTKKNFEYDNESVNVDFSLLNRYTDENKLNPKIIYVRTDYFDIIKDKNYFTVSTCNSINYNITETDKETLQFFLQNLFDKKDFRPGQFAIISNALNLNDTIGLLPTGGGKSLCYQLPCLLQPSISFVVCPIKSLMYDQEENLRTKDVLITNISCCSSDMSAAEREKVMSDYAKGHYLFIWISPERFQIVSFRESIKSLLNNFSITYAVIDEVHCLSEWGHDFRTSYLNLAKTIDNLSYKDKYGEGTIKYIGLTATASLNVLKDIKVEFARQKQQLEDDNIKSLLDYSREELHFNVIKVENKFDELCDIIKNSKISEERAALIFTPFVNGEKGCYLLSQSLSTKTKEDVKWYSGSCPKIYGSLIFGNNEFNEYKKQIQSEFKKNKFSILCSTKAFGMGIDKSNIFYTFHYGLPSSTEALYQEAGRAGRWDKQKFKKQKAECYILYTPEQEENISAVEQIFRKDTNIENIKYIQQHIKKQDKQDVFAQLYLLNKNINDVRHDYNIIIAVIKAFFEQNKKKKIFTKDLKNIIHNDKTGLSEEEFEKIIYRLSLLGVVKDWTRDFKDSFTVTFDDITDEHVLKSVSDYITKYSPEKNVRDEILKIDVRNVNTMLEKSIWYLLDWIFNNIVYKRKQALKNVADLCRDFKNSEDFKNRIDDIFRITDTTTILQHVAENPFDWEKWFSVFYSNDKFITQVEFRKLQDRMSRFLESYSSNIGLNFISGIIRLKLDNFEDTDGRIRFENTIKEISHGKTKIEQDKFLNTLKLFIKDNFNKDEQITICLSLLNFYPQLTEEFASYYDLPILLKDMLIEKTKELRNINIKLYENLRKF